MLNYEALGPNQFLGRRNSIVQRLRQQPHADIKGLQKLADTRTDLRQFTGGRKCDNLQVSLVQAIAQTCLLSLNPDPAESMTVSRLAVTNFESAFQGFQRPSSPSNLARWKSERPAHHLPDDFCFGAVVPDDLLRSLLPRSASNQRDIPSSVQTPVFFADDSTAEVYWLKVSRIDDGLEGLYPNVAEMGATVISSDLHVALHSMWTTAEITGFRGLWSLTPKTLLTSNMDAVPDYQFASPVLKGRSLELSALCAFWALRGGIPGDAEFQFREPVRLDPEAGTTRRQQNATFGLAWKVLPTEVDDSFPGNAWGLFQMHGNVWEWCADTAHFFSRVVRGGSFRLEATYARCSNRVSNAPSGSDFDTGCRVARADF